MNKGKVLQVLSYAMLIIAAFLSLNFSKDLGLIYTVLIVSIALSALIDKNIEFPLYREDGWLKALAYGIGGYILLALTSTLILQGFFSAQGLGFIKVITSSIPVFATSNIFIFFSYVIFIGTIETVAFLRLNELFGNLAKSDFKLLSISTWFVLILTCSIFAIFHATAKGLNFISLLIVGIMMAISILITLLTKDMRAAIILHWVANGLAILFTFKLLPQDLISMLTFS